MLAKAKNPCISVGTEIIAPVTGKIAEPVHYKLCGVLHHHGEPATSGHYTVDVLHPNRDCSGEGWLHIDDEAMNAVRHEDVFGSDDNEWRNNQCAYLLFYCRTAPAWT
jgi:ubiquitin C-terminal hydrolase